MEKIRTPEQRFLRGMPQLGMLEDHEIIELATRLNKRKYSRGEYIFFQGEQVRHLYFLEMGRVEIFKSDINGRKLTLWYIGEDEIFCLANLYAPVAFATAKVIEDTLAYSLDKEYFDQLTERSGKFARNLLRCLSGKLSSYSELVDDMAFRKIEERVAKILLEHVPADGPPQFICSLSQEELAAMAGTSREVVARCLKSFREKGLIRSQHAGRKRCLIVENFSGLREVAAPR
ncbi:MAG: Crp/Fnr family transcriptional regulator [Desulfobulbaceae bacterium]